MDRVHRFAVVLEPEEEGGFTVRVPSLPEIVTFGKDEDLAMAEDAIGLILEYCLARGEPIPGSQPPRVREVTVTLAASAGGCRRSGLETSFTRISRHSHHSGWFLAMMPSRGGLHTYRA